MEQNSFTDLWNKTESATTGEFAPIEQGSYVVEVEKVSYDMSSQPNKVEFVMKISGSADGENCGVVNRKVWKNYQMTEKGLPWFKKDLAVLGIDAASVKSVDDLTVQLQSLVGAKLEVFIKPTVSKTNPSKTFDTVYFNELIEKAGKSDSNELKF